MHCSNSCRFGRFTMRQYGTGYVHHAPDPHHARSCRRARHYAGGIRENQGSLGREPSLTELGIFSVMWSEHCSYKSSRVHLKRLPTKSELVLQGPGENAGIIDIGDGWACAFKIESHNHPSYIEPFQGAATGVGGILRDIFTMGARPLAVMDSLRFGPIPAGRATTPPEHRAQKPLHHGRRGQRHRRIRQLFRRAESRRRNSV